MYWDETLTSFFRRLCFLPDGSLLLTPASQIKMPTLVGSEEQTSSKNINEDLMNTVYVYARGRLDCEPVAHLPGFKRPSVAIKCCPITFKLRPVSGEVQSTMRMGYRLVYAVATQDSVLVYDTQDPKPLCVLSHLHYATFTDLAWSPDGTALIMSSTDGYCSIVSFAPGELGEPLEQAPEVATVQEDAPKQEVVMANVNENVDMKENESVKRKEVDVVVNDVSLLVRKKIKS